MISLNCGALVLLVDNPLQLMFVIPNQNSNQSFTLELDSIFHGHSLDQSISNIKLMFDPASNSVLVFSQSHKILASIQQIPDHSKWSSISQLSVSCIKLPENSILSLSGFNQSSTKLSIAYFKQHSVIQQRIGFYYANESKLWILQLNYSGLPALFAIAMPKSIASAEFLSPQLLMINIVMTHAPIQF
jgi:hypothetical protein